MCTPARTIHQTQRLGATVGCHGSNKRPKHGATGNHWKPLETTNSNDPTGRKLPALSDLARQVSQPGIFTRSASAAWTLDIWSQKSEIYPGQNFKLVILMGHIMLPYIYIYIIYCIHIIYICVYIYIYIYMVIDLKVLVRSFNCESRACYVGNPRESFFFEFAKVKFYFAKVSRKLGITIIICKGLPATAARGPAGEGHQRMRVAVAKFPKVRVFAFPSVHPLLMAGVCE